MGDWVKYKTENGQIFFYNELNGEFQWDNPFEKGSATSNSSPDSKKEKKKKNASEDAPSSDFDTANSGKSELKRASSGEWQPFKDPSSNKVIIDAKPRLQHVV